MNKQCPACFAELLSSSSYDDDIDKTSHTHRPQKRGVPPSSVHDDKALQPQHDDDEEEDEYDFECSSSTLTTAEETISSFSSASLSSSLSSLDGHNAAHYATTDEDNNADVTHRTKVVCGMPYVYYSYDVRGPSQEYCNQGGGNRLRRRHQEQQCQEHERHGFYTGEIDAITSLPHGIGTWRCSSNNSPNINDESGHGGTILLEGSWFDGHLYTQSNSPQSNHQHNHHHSSTTQSQQQRRLTPIMEHSSRAYDDEEESCIMYTNNDECQGRRRRVGMNSFVLESINNDDDDDEPIYNNESGSVRRRTRRSVDPPSSLDETHIVSERRESGGGDGVGRSSSNERGTREKISSLSLCSPCRI